MKYMLKTCKWVALAILALLAAIALPSLAAHPEMLCLGMIGLAPVGFSRGKFFEPSDDAKGAVVLDEAQKTALLTGVKAIQEQNKTLTENFGNLQKETKTAFEELTNLKNNQGTMEETLRSLQKVNLQLSLERRMAFGSLSPVARISADPEKKARFNAFIRSLLSTTSQDLAEQVKSIRKAIGEDSTPGSTLINNGLLADIYDSLAMFGKWNTLGVRQMGTKLTKLPVKTARPIAYVLMSEGDTLSDDSNKAGTSVDLEVELIGVLLNVSLQLLQDAEFDVTADVLNDFSEAVSYRIDYLAFQANGTSTGTAAKLHGGMTGVFNFGTAATAAAGNVTVEQTDFEDWTRAQLSVDSAVNTRPGARWWMHPFQLIRALSVKDLNGRPIFLTALEAPSAGAVGTILGKPVEQVEAAPSTNTASSKIAVYGDPEAYVVGVRNDFEFDLSDHHKWNTYQRSFRGVARAGTKGRKASALSVLTLPAA